MPIYTSSSESDNEPSRPSRTTPRPRPPRLLGSQRPIHDILGGGKVADVLLWKNITVSASLLIGMTVIWFLFEVVEYNFVTLLCHISITSMLALFIWSKGAEFFNWKPPQIPEVILRESTFREVASTLRVRFNKILSKLLDVACGKDPGLFILVIAILYIFSVIGTYFSFLNLLYLGFICILTVPFLYDRYDEHVDYIADREFRRMKKMFRRFNSQFLNKIPRGPVKEN
ncbi:reticulon-like protein B9 [Citrus sinensis]|uniref:reticulon-like protein B9 n=1 Tax=Citrus sinensis TaxID=2711 RepID=UPI00219C532F|nr:reticulon-like protein B9 [Citrus sinensis]KAH9722868.1 reticulon-like protein B9 [Citrus sinensis]